MQKQQAPDHSTANMRTKPQRKSALRRGAKRSQRGKEKYEKTQFILNKIVRALSDKKKYQVLIDTYNARMTLRSVITLILINTERKLQKRHPINNLHKYSVRWVKWSETIFRLRQSTKMPMISPKLWTKIEDRRISELIIDYVLSEDNRPCLWSEATE